MAKTVVNAAKATITVATVEIGITDLTFGAEYEEIEAFDTKSEDYLGGKTSYPISFTYAKDVEVANLALNTSLAVSIAIKDDQSTPKTATWTGNIKLFSESNNLSEGSVLTVTVNGKFTAAYTEANT